MTIRITGISHIGSRPRNEDAWRGLCLGNVAVIALADGLGGHPEGQLAAKIAVDAAVSAFQSEKVIPLRQRAEGCLQAAQDALLDGIQKTASAMRSTLCLLILQEEQAICAWIGDSRLYCLRKGEVLYRTTDHSVAQALVAAGEIQPDDLATHEDRHQLTRALGMEQPRFSISEPFPVQSGDRFLLCSDGWWETLRPQALLAEYDSPAEWLQSQFTERSGDNRTAVAVYIQEGDTPYAVETL